MVIDGSILAGSFDVVVHINSLRVHMTIQWNQYQRPPLHKDRLYQVTTIELSTVSPQPPSSTSTGRPPVYREHLFLVLCGLYRQVPLCAVCVHMYVCCVRNQAISVLCRLSRFHCTNRGHCGVDNSRDFMHTYNKRVTMLAVAWNMVGLQGMLDYRDVWIIGMLDYRDVRL